MRYWLKTVTLQYFSKCLQRGTKWVARDSHRKGQDCEPHILQHAHSRFNNTKARRGTAGYSRGYAEARKWENNPQLSTLTYGIFYQQKHIGAFSFFFFFCMCGSHLSQAREIGPVWGGKWQRNWMLDHSEEQSTASHLFPLLSRGSQIRNNQNPAGNNIWHLNWVGCTTDVSNVSLSRSFYDCFFFFL